MDKEKAFEAWWVFLLGHFSDIPLGESKFMKSLAKLAFESGIVFERSQNDPRT